MCLRGLWEPGGGHGGGRGGLSVPSACTRSPRAVQLLDAGGFSTAHVAPGRYDFLLGLTGCPSLIVAGRGWRVPGAERALWLSWDEAEVAGGHEMWLQRVGLG